MFWWQPFCALKQQSVVCPQFCYFPLQSLSGLLRVRLLNTEILSDSRYAEIRRATCFLHFRLCVLSCFEFESGMIGNMGRPEQPWRTGHSQGLGKSSGRLGRGQDHSELPMSVQFESKYIQISVYYGREGGHAPPPTEATRTSKPAFDQIIRYNYCMIPSGGVGMPCRQPKRQKLKQRYAALMRPFDIFRQFQMMKCIEILKCVFCCFGIRHIRHWQPWHLDILTAELSVCWYFELTLFGQTVCN